MVCFSTTLSLKSYSYCIGSTLSFFEAANTLLASADDLLCN
jgi:hypothetical protein